MSFTLHQTGTGKWVCSVDMQLSLMDQTLVLSFDADEWDTAEEAKTAAVRVLRDWRDEVAHEFAEAIRHTAECE